MKQPAGRNLSLSLPRRLIGDLMHASRNVAMIPMERRMDLASLVRTRDAASQRISWCAIFTKAYAMVCARRPELRRAYLTFPWPRLYEHPCNIATIAVEREYDGEGGVFFAPAPSPERRSVLVLDGFLRNCKEQPVESIATFREVLKITRLPLPLRRSLWWWRTEVNGLRRAQFLGTFGVSVTAGLGAGQLCVRSPLTTVLHYGQFDRSGCLDMRITFDHRVLDGGCAARALADLESVLLNEMHAELHSMRGSQSLAA